MFRGYRTYIVAGAMLALAGCFFLAGSTPTYANPEAECSGVMKNVVAWVLLTQGAGLVTIRWALKELGSHGVIRF